MNSELDPRTDPLMARIRRAQPADLHEVPSATEPAAQALMKEIMMSESTLEHTKTVTPSDARTTGDANIISWDPPRRRRLMAVAAAAAIVVGAVGVSIVIQESSSATDRVHAAAIETRDLGSGVVRTDVAIVDADGPDGAPLSISDTGTIRFDGDDWAFESDAGGETGDIFRTITVDGRVYSTLLGEQWQDVTDASGDDRATPMSFRLDEVLGDLEQLDGYTDDGDDVVDGVSTTRYRVTAEVGDLDGSAVGAFSLSPTIGGALPVGPVEYTVWIDGDGVIARLRAEGGDSTRSLTTDARFSDLGIPQTIEAPDDFIVFDPSATRVFEILAATPEAVLDECIPDVQNMSDLSAEAFTGIIDCFRAGGADAAADIFTELGPVGLDAAARAVAPD